MMYLRSNTKLACVVLSLAILAVPLLAQDQTNDFVQGRMDGEMDGKSDANVLWIVAGIGCGCIGVGAAYLFTPSAPAAKLVGQSSDYVLGYSDAYKKARRNKEAGYAGIGWLIWIIIYFSTMAEA